MNGLYECMNMKRPNVSLKSLTAFEMEESKDFSQTLYICLHLY